MKKLTVSIGAAIIMFCAAGVFAQGADQANPVAKGNLVVKLFDMGYSFARSGGMYEGDDADILGINDSHAGFMYDTYFPIGTEINYFIIEGLAIGGSIHYAQTELQTGEKLDVWSIGPSAYYYININGMLIPYVTISCIYSKFESETIFDLSLMRIPIGAGATVMVGKNIGCFGQFLYSFNTNDDGSTSHDGKMAIISFGIKAFF